MGARDRAAATEAVVGSWRASIEAAAPRRRPPADQRQGACTALPSTLGAPSGGAKAQQIRSVPDLRACGAAARGDDRFAERRPEEWLLISGPRIKAADQILVVRPCGQHPVSAPGRLRQAALADRARLSRAQAGGWARRFRRPRLARLSPSRHAVHRSLRIPDLRAGDNSPLRTWSRHAAPGTCPTQRLSSPRIRPCGLNAIFRYDRHHAHTIDRCARPDITAMPMLWSKRPNTKIAPQNYNAVRLSRDSRLR